MPASSEVNDNAMVPVTLTQHNFVLTLDVRTKMFISLLASLVVIFFKGQLTLGFFLAISLVYVLNIGKWKIITLCYVAMGLMWMVSVGFIYIMHTLVEQIPVSSPSEMMIPFMRSLIMLNTVLVLALTSRVQSLLGALKSLRLPMFIYIPTVVVIRFIPNFIVDVQQIHENMRTRGYNLSPLFFIKHFRLSIRLLIAPMLFRALRSADELAIAAELKGIRHDTKMINYKPQRFRGNDFIAFLALIFIIATGVVLEQHFAPIHKGGMM